MFDIINRKYQLIPMDDGISQSDTAQAKIKRLIKEKFYNRFFIFTFYAGILVSMFSRFKGYGSRKNTDRC